MKHLRVLPLLAVALLTTAEAWAQYGLYGAPEVLPLPRPHQQSAPGGLAYSSATMLDPSAPAVVPTFAADPEGQPLTVAPEGMPIQTPLPGAAPAPNVIDRMLEQAPADGGRSDECGSFGAAVADGCCPPCVPCYQSQWYVEAAGLIMGRNDARRLWTTYRTDNEPLQLMNSDDVDMDWAGGAEIRFGRNICCGIWSLEGTFWGLFPESGGALWDDGLVSTPLIVDDIEFDDGVNPAVNGMDLFDRADAHRLWRKEQIYNLELNLIRHQLETCGPLNCDWGLGVRWFHFDEEFEFASLDEGFTWGEDPTREAYLRDEVDNDLLGFQIGCNVSYQWNRLKLFAAPTCGVFGNHMQHEFIIYRGDGVVATPTVDSGMQGIASYPVKSSETSVSFLSEIDIGLSYEFLPRWNAFGGYRVVYATGMALAENQIPSYVIDTPELAEIDNDGDFVLHGAFGGVSYSF